MAEENEQGAEAEATVDPEAPAEDEPRAEVGPGGDPGGADDDEAESLASEAEAVIDDEAEASTDRSKSKVELDRELEELAADAGGDERRRTTPEPAGGTDEQFCRNCGSAIDREAAICPDCGVRQDAVDEGGETDPGIAGLLSFVIPGAGNIYDGDSERGLVILVAWAAWLFVGWFLGGMVLIPLVGTLTLGLGLLLWLVLPVVELVVHAVAAYDAYSRAS